VAVGIAAYTSAMPRRFAGVRPELVDSFLERVELGAGVDVGRELDRWKELRRQGFDVTVLGADDGGQCTHLIALGCRYLAGPCAKLSA
jgi:hypothetical protein